MLVGVMLLCVGEILLKKKTPPISVCAIWACELAVHPEKGEIGLPQGRTRDVQGGGGAWLHVAARPSDSSK